MDTEFEILRRFETQLMRVAERDKRRAESPPPKRSRRPWRAAIAVAAALLSLSFVVGLLATGGSVLGGGSAASSASSAAGSAPNPGPSSAPGFALPAGGGQALGVSGGAPGAAHLGVKAPALQAAPTIDQGATTSTGAGPTTEQPASAPPEGQADLSKIIRDGQISVTIDDGTFKATGRFRVPHRRGERRVDPVLLHGGRRQRLLHAARSPRRASTRRWSSWRSSGPWTRRRARDKTSPRSTSTSRPT